MTHNENDLVSEMTIKVSFRDFHQIHSEATANQILVQRNDLSTFTKSQLESTLVSLKAGQRLTDAENGSDFMYATSYLHEITIV